MTISSRAGSRTVTARPRPRRKEDPILGWVYLCGGCGEYWPDDDEFYYFVPDRFGTLRRAGRCRACWAERDRSTGRRVFPPLLIQEGSLS